jgi:hypothetical protein
MKTIMKLLSVCCAVLVASPLLMAKEHHKGAASDTTSSATEKQMAMKEFKVVTFGKSDYNLTDAQKQALKSLIDTARADGEIKAVHIAAWSDKQFPKGKKELKDADKELAKERIDALENYLKSDLKVSDVDTHSMAEHSGWLARAFNTTEAEIKSLFAQRGAPGSEPEYRLVRKNGGPQKAVIWVEMKKGGTTGAANVED